MFDNLVWTDGEYICRVGNAFIYCNSDNLSLFIIAIVGLLGLICFLINLGDYEYE